MLFRRYMPRFVPRPKSRIGVAMTEFAFAGGLFFMITLAIIEFGRFFMISQILNSTARTAARGSVVDGATTAQLVSKINGLLANAGLGSVPRRIFVINGQGYDDNPNSPPNLGALIQSMKDNNTPNFEVDDSDPRQLFIVRVEIDFHSVALVTPKWIPNIPIYGQVVMRHE